jgi:hypothetical protein
VNAEESLWGHLSVAGGSGLYRRGSGIVVWELTVPEANSSASGSANTSEPPVVLMAYRYGSADERTVVGANGASILGVGICAQRPPLVSGHLLPDPAFRTPLDASTTTL